MSSVLDGALERLECHGWATVSGWPGASTLGAFWRQQAPESAAWKPAGVGAAGQATVAEDLRLSHMHWLDDTAVGDRAFLAEAEALRQVLNRRFFLGLFRFEACYLSYPVGGYFVRHRDSLRGARNRVVSLVTYLDHDWRDEDGGQLIIYDAHGDVSATILPRFGTSVPMMSEDVEHEVLPCHRPRHAIAGWWHVNDMMPAR